MSATFKPPKLSHHKATGRAFVKFLGKFVYFGRWGSPESQTAYEEWIREQERLRDPTGRLTTRIDRLCVEFLKHALEYYVDESGVPTTEVNCYQQALRVVDRLFGKEPASEFNPLKLKAVREEFVKLGWARTVVNRQTARVKSVFRWGVENMMVPGSVVEDLNCVAGLKRGRCKVRETAPVPPVDVEVVESTIPFIPETIALMVRLQLLTGMRPSEVRLMKVGEVDTRGDVWLYKPGRHKNSHHGKDRTIPIGPQGQALLMPLIGDAVQADSFVFTTPDGEPYTLAAIRRAITRGCERAFEMPDELRNIARALKDVEPSERPRRKRELQKQAKEWRAENCWTPNQLRHTCATLINQRVGDIDASRVILGHAEKSTTEVYAERDLGRAVEIMKLYG
ncbi:MAG: tyrosine-type recombinase/integrase [Planctomycetaceae bacterium]|nr:tyrosine-type recombinase/integrase [Planctomycetaceae bacterium]